MLMPENIHPENSLYYTGSVLLSHLFTSRKVDLLELYSLITEETKMTFSLYVLSIDWLFLSGLIKIEKGQVILCS